MRLALACLPLALLVACDGKETATDSTPTVTDDTDGGSDEEVDLDGDGYAIEHGDCDDDNADVHPGAEELCNGIDDNCNDLADEGFGDSDGDGTVDCFDTEECDGVDNDGDGDVDEGYADADGDSVADCLSEEVCDGVDNNGDGEIDEGFDADGDGYTTCEDDCDDGDAAVNPGATEIEANDVDDDCDGVVDPESWNSGELLIVEMMVNPTAVTDSYGEWIELYNASSERKSLDGLVLSDSTGDWHQVDSSGSLEVDAGDVVVLGLAEASDNGGVEVDYVYDNMQLSNESDDLYLMMGDTVLDSVSWDDGATMPDDAGASVTLDPWQYDSLSNDDPGNWCPSKQAWGVGTDLGTPGDENELCTTVDHDGDGYNGDEGDCDDTDATVYPGAYEITSGVDNDCDGDAEWMPTAVADYDALQTSLEHCQTIYLDGSGSYDPDGGSLTYSWELTTLPPGSSDATDQIMESTDQNPEFVPDSAGDYQFTLVVDDGGTSSQPSTLDLTVAERISNIAPTASAGLDQSESVTGECTFDSYGDLDSCDDCDDVVIELDSSATVDPDDGELIYSWSVLTGSYATIDDSTAASPTLTISGIASGYETTTTDSTVVQLTVTDCYGESSTANVSITVECTGE